MPSEMTAEEFHNLPSPSDLEREAVLVAALERLRDCDWVITLPDRMDAVREIAREALAKYRGER